MGWGSCCGALDKHVAGKGMRQVGKLACMPDPDTKSGFGQSWEEDPYPGLDGQFMQGQQGQSWKVASGAAGSGGGGCIL